MVSPIPKKYLTLEQANRILPRVEKLLLKMRKMDKSLNTLSAIEVEYEDSYEALVYDVQYDKKFHQLSHVFFQAFTQLMELGAVLKSPEEGLVDFYSLHEGKEIFLCWQLGELSITHWHGIEDGFEGRQPISLLRKGARVR